MNDPEGFSAWIYGVASKRYKGRQILWLQGKHGEDGKTYIQKLIAEALFPNVSQPMVNSALSGDASRWMGAEFIGKTLAYWDDCNNRRALFMEVVKQLSAGSQGNKARIESKGVMAYQGELDTRLWINSNFAPEVSQDNFITSRLLYITIEKMAEDPDPEIGTRFKAELPQFFRYAKACYERCCPDDYAIVQPDHVSLGHHF
jgi:phage/plasmid-associated DNA primase